MNTADLIAINPHHLEVSCGNPFDSPYGEEERPRGPD